MADWGPVSCKPGCAACCNAWVHVGLGEAQYLWSTLDQVQRERAVKMGGIRLAELVDRRTQPDWPTEHFLRGQGCPLLTEEHLCGAYQSRPLACRGVLTDLDPGYCQPGVVPGLEGEARQNYYQQLQPRRHGPEHYLSRPMLLGQQLAEEVWALERQLRGFTVIGELCGLLAMLQDREFQAQLESLVAVRRYLKSRGVLGGEWGYWAG